MSITPRTRRRVRAIKLAIFTSLAVVFGLDMVLPLGNAIAVPYVAVVLLTLWLRDRKIIFQMTALITVLAVVGFYSPYPEGPLLSLSLRNRIMVLIMVWIAAVWGSRLIREQEAAQRERDFNEGLVETASSIILLLDTQSRIIFFNRSTTECLGYSLEEVAGKDWFETCVPEHQRSRARGLFRQFVEEESVREIQYPLLTRDGRERQFSWSFKAMRDGERNETIARVLFVGQDVTTLLEAQQQVVANERLAAIGQTIAAISHETRNELQSLKLGLEMLSASLTDPQAQQVLEHMQTSLHRLHRLLDDVRHFAGPMPLERSRVSLPDVWRQAWESLTVPCQDRDVEFHERLECPRLECSIDPLRIEQVFRNLFENTLAACSDPVCVEVVASTIAEHDQEFLQIAVRDNGPGLSPEARQKIFEPFFTTKQSGTGLGMAISLRILKAHGGELRLGKSQGGAEFLLRLPQDETANDQKSPQEAAESVGDSAQIPH